MLHVMIQGALSEGTTGRSDMCLPPLPSFFSPWCCLPPLVVQVVVMGDGQATANDFIVKPNVVKVGGKAGGGGAGSRSRSRGSRVRSKGSGRSSSRVRGLPRQASTFLAVCLPPTRAAVQHHDEQHMCHQDPSG
jgi:hypothetical protein